MNPYMAPEPMAQAHHMPMGNDTSQATFTILSGMRSTKPVLSFLGAALIALGALFAFGSSSFARGPFAGFGVGVGLVYLVMAGIYGYIGVLLWGYRGGIDNYLASNGDLESLAIAVTRQASFWRFVGILTVIAITFYILAFFVMMVGFAGAMR